MHRGLIYEARFPMGGGNSCDLFPDTQHACVPCLRPAQAGLRADRRNACGCWAFRQRQALRRAGPEPNMVQGRHGHVI
jgi:hypothetical protein